MKTVEATHEEAAILSHAAATSPEAIITACSKIDVSTFALPLRLAVKVFEGNLVLYIAMPTAPDRIGGGSKGRSFSKITPLPPSQRSALNWVRSVIRDAVLHELDECLIVDGTRLWDPHEFGEQGF